MKKSRYELSFREQKIMDLLWENHDGLTSVDMLAQLSDVMSSPTHVHRAITSLLSKGLIQECGSVRYNKQYARKFQPALSREEYAAGLLEEKGFSLDSLNSIAAAFLKHSEKPDPQKKEQIIDELKQIIDELEKENET